MARGKEPTESLRNVGVDITPAELVFEAGFKATKTIRIRNIGLQPLPVTAEGPGHKTFSVAVSSSAPKVSPGTTLTVAVTFRASIEGGLNDQIEVTTPSGTVVVPVRVVVPTAELGFPDTVQLGLVSVGGQGSSAFRITNPSRFDVCWTMTVPSPFAVSPTSGVIPATGFATITATFSPDAARRFGCSATLKYDAGDGGKGEARLALKGSAQYPYILCDLPLSEALEFQSTSMNARLVQELTLKNVSPVPASFKVVRGAGPAELDQEGHRFKVISGSSGLVQPTESVVVKIGYTPFFPGENSTEYFSVDVVGGVSQRFACHGTATSLEVSLKPDTVRFVDVPCSAMVTKTATLHNNSDIPTTFQIVGGGDSVFHVEPASGKLEPRSTKKVTIKFSPELPWRYHREVTILVLNHPPLTLRILANSHDVAGKYAHLAPKPRAVLPLHLENARHFAAVDLAGQQPSTLRQMLEEEGTLEIIDGRLMPCMPPEDDLEALQYIALGTPGGASDIDPDASKNGSRALTLTSANSAGPDNGGAATPTVARDTPLPTTSASPVVLSPGTIDFGSCPSGSVKRIRSIGSRKIDVRNTSESVAEVMWMVPEGPLTLEPRYASLEPGEEATFTLNFRPTRSDCFFEATLECYVDMSQALRDSRIEDAFISRPFCLPVHVAAETFNGEPMPPSSLQWGSDRVVCNPVAAGETAFASVEVRNACGSSARLACTGTKHGEDVVVQCTPRTCIVQPGEVQVLSIAVSRRTAGVAEYLLSFDVNSDTSVEVAVVHSVYEPSITFGSNGTVSFLPTGRSGESQTTLTMRSTSQVPVSYQWRVPTDLEGLVMVDPEGGFILPNQTLTSMWTYAPRGPGSICTSVPIDFGSGGDSVGLTASVVVTGSCLSGALVAAPQRINFGNVISGEALTACVTLYNPSGVDVAYELGVDLPDVTLDDGDAVGVLKPLERKTLPITVTSNIRGEVTGSVVHRVVGASDSDDPTRLVTLRYKTISPELAVTNAFCVTLSKSELWRRFSILRLNELINGTRDMAADDDELVFNFGAGLESDEPCAVYLQLENSGSCETAWALQFPDNLRYVPDERWAESGDFDPAADHEKDILKSKIFEASPRSGVLQPRAKATVRLEYKHSRVAVDSLAVILKVAGRAGLPLRLLGSTLSRGAGYIDLEWQHMELAPLPIGMQLPPTQYITAVNRGDTAVRVTVDKSGFSDLATQNYGFPIMQCGGGTDAILVEPGENLVLPIRFQPMEAKTYVARLKVYASAARVSSDSVSIVARGYDPRDGAVPIYVPTAVPAEPYCGGAKGRVAALMCEALDFGVVALNSICHRMLCIHNTSADGHSIVFDFRAQEFEGVLKFSPSSGRVDSNEIVAIRVSFCPDGVPQIYNIDAVCAVTDEQYVLQHEQSVVAHSESVIASENTFNYSDAGRVGRGRAGVYVGSVTDPRRPRINDEQGEELSDTMLRSGRYHALPPIKRKEVTAICEPAPKKPPQRLFCAITATSVSPDEIPSKSFVNRNVQELTNTGLQSGAAKEDLIVGELLENMLCDLLGDADFNGALVDKYDDATPTIYYRQLLNTDDTTIPEDETHGDTALLSCLENLLENTLANIVAEGLDGTFDVTARTRRIVSA